MATTVVSRLGDEEYRRGITVTVDETPVFHPLPGGSSALVSAVMSNSIIVIPENVEGLTEGETVEAEVSHSLHEAENTLNLLKHHILACGSHDLLLDLISNEISENSSRLSLSSIHTGSMGAITSVTARTAHFGGIHLLDVDTGTYNIPQITKCFGLEGVKLVHLCKREQGLIVAKGNPLKITTLSCGAEKQYRFINRQRGSGTRLLLDILLNRYQIDPATVKGYSREETTHVGVALRVKNNFADYGLGIKAAASAMGCDFIPLETENYDLLMTTDFFQSATFELILKIIKSEHFRRKAEALGGYNLASAGKVLI
jgi:putative molybdopterin biosynthesis protein